MVRMIGLCRAMLLGLMTGAMLSAAGSAHAGTLISAQELANRLGMTCTADRITSRLTLTDGNNEIVICPGMFNLMVNRRMVSMDSRAECRGGGVYVPDTVVGTLRGYMRSAPVRTASAPSFSRYASTPSYSAPSTPSYSVPSTPSYSSSYTPEPTYQPIYPGAWKVVVDAGHGGKDPGAVGHGGTKEKAVNLSIALALRDQLQARGFTVVMTRQDDTFVELEERANICNRAQGDLFVCVHSNASPQPTTKGSEIYFVDDQGEFTATARGIAAARTMDIPPRAMGTNTRLDFLSKEILFGALLEDFRIQSRELAEYIQGSFGGSVINASRGIFGNKGLRVLRFTRCPGTLVEVGFLSNPQTEQMLRQDYYRRGLAASIAEGVTRFKAAQDRALWRAR